MARLRNLLGQQFGDWTVLSRAPNKNNLVYWHCKCKCGTERDVRSATLLRGTSTNCGCVRKQKLSDTKINIIGQTFNYLTVLDFSNEKGWKCQCKCGKIHYVKQGYDLRSGHIKSCGCMKIDAAREKIKDLTGQRFGKLTVKQIAQYNPVKWECQCDCGNITIVMSSSLVQGLTQSCGCLKSKGEGKIIDILIKNNIPFVTQKSFESCLFPDTKVRAHFDFYIEDKYLIEYDGEQHYINTNSGWNTSNHLERVHYRDLYKTKWCKEHNIPLIRIPYYQYKDLCIDDLRLETSSFIV